MAAIASDIVVRVAKYYQRYVNHEHEHKNIQIFTYSRKLLNSIVSVSSHLVLYLLKMENVLYSVVLVPLTVDEDLMF